MSYLTLRLRGLSALIAVVGTLGWVSSAEAIISRKVWDPAYGAALPNLGWSGTVDFNISDSCLAGITTSMWVTNSTAGCSGKLNIDSASVTLYDLNNTSSNVVLKYDGATSWINWGNVDVVLRMYVDVNGSEKTIKATQGGFLIPEFATASFAKVVGYDAAAYWLNFNENITNTWDLQKTTAPDGDYAFLTSCSFNKGYKPGSTETYDSYKAKDALYSDISCSQNDGINFPAILRPVPEPSTYLLGLASFGVIGMWARRRRQVPLTH